MSVPEFELTLERVRRARRQVCESLGWETDFGREEFRNLVFERLTREFGLPWEKTEHGELPDWNHPLVAKLSQDLNNFQEEVDKECDF